MIFAKLDYSNIEHLKNEGINISSKFKAPIYINFTENAFAYNYYGNAPVKINMEMTNKLNYDADFDIIYRIEDENGQIAFEKNEEKHFKAGEKQECVFEATPSKYGLLTLKVIASEKNGEISGTSYRKFSYFNIV